MPDVTEPISLAFGFLAIFFDKEDVPNPETQSMWDMNAQSACPLREVMDRSLLRVTKDSEGTDGDVVFYTINSKSDITTRFRGGIKWTRAIQDPITVLDIVRRNLGPDIESVLNFLVHSGIPFYGGPIKYVSTATTIEVVATCRTWQASAELEP
ncbi:hypothetical protein AX14_005274 [Amanita brunnescens Koide BX004]|nr:hypothetical protein AX14_005274 [Amanita brunnescens Koide BX004]